MFTQERYGALSSYLKMIENKESQESESINIQKSENSTKKWYKVLNCIKNTVDKIMSNR